MANLYKTFVALLLINLFSFAYAQCDTLRYQEPVFNSITQHKDVKYGEAEVWNVPYNDKDLFMDIFVPDNDTLSKRPLMIWVHPGGFLNGNKELEDMVALCDSFARRGYVTATIDYRKGFNPTSKTSAERAVYRGTQDLRAAIRYLKEHHNSFKIDTNYTFIGGSSAGAFSTVHTVYMDQNEAPASIASGIGYPGLGCLDCSGNDYSHNMDITGFVNLWGAIGDSTWINPDETASGLHIHGKDDGTVPFGVGHPFGVPTTPITHGSRTISNQLTALNIPHTTYFVEGQGHEFHGTSNGDWETPPTPYWDTIYNLIETHYTNLLRKDIFSIYGDNTACEGDTLTFTVGVPEEYKLCWEVDNATIIDSDNGTIQIVCDQPGEIEINAKQFSEIAMYNGKASFSVEVNPQPTATFESETEGMNVTFTATPSGFSHYYWVFGDGNSSNDPSPTHQYAAPGNYSVSLTVRDHEGCENTIEEEMDFSTLKVVSEAMIGIDVYPNPSNNVLFISSEKELNQLMIYDYQGQLIKNKKLKGTDQYKINVKDLSSGMYVLKLIDHQGRMYSSKISVNN